MSSRALSLADQRADRRRWWVLAVVGLAQLLVLLDTTVVNIALPAAQRELGMSDTSRQWTITAYTLVFGGLLLLGGRLADQLGRRNTLLVGIAGFALASAVGGAAVNQEMLIGARAVQGVFAALLAPSTMSMLTVTFTEDRERAKAFGVFGAIIMSGAAIGLLVGGALAEYLNWRWCLYVNLPISVVAGVVGAILLPRVEGHRDTGLDWLSGLLGSVGICALVYGLSEVATSGWGSPLVLGMFGAALVLLAGFVVRQATATRPLLPLGVIADRGRAAAFLAVAAAPFGMFGMFFFLTYQLQVIAGYGALTVGFAFLPMLFGNMVVSTQLTRRLLPRVGPRVLLCGGLLLIALGMLGLTLLTPTSSFWGLIMPAELVLGVGAGLVMPTVMTSATAGIAAKDSGVASAFITASQQVGASIGTALLNTIAAGATVSAVGVGAAAATVHGYATASAWAAGVLAASAVVVAVLARGRDASAA